MPCARRISSSILIGIAGAIGLLIASIVLSPLISLLPRLLSVSKPFEPAFADVSLRFANAVFGDGTPMAGRIAFLMPPLLVWATTAAAVHLAWHSRYIRRHWRFCAGSATALVVLALANLIAAEANSNCGPGGVLEGHCFAVRVGFPLVFWEDIRGFVSFSRFSLAALLIDVVISLVLCLGAGLFAERRLQRSSVLQASAIACAVFIVAAQPSAQESPRGVNGLFVITRQGPIELIAYAEEVGRGLLRMTAGTLEDAPHITQIVSVVSSIPTWLPNGVVAATTRIFDDDRAERRLLRTTGRKLNIYAVELRVIDLEQRETIESLLREINASREHPGYAFVVLTTSSGYRRYYPIRLNANP